MMDWQSNYQGLTGKVCPSGSSVTLREASSDPRRTSYECEQGTRTYGGLALHLPFI